MGYPVLATAARVLETWQACRACSIAHGFASWLASNRGPQSRRQDGASNASVAPQPSGYDGSESYSGISCHAKEARTCKDLKLIFYYKHHCFVGSLSFLYRTS